MNHHFLKFNLIKHLFVLSTVSFFIASKPLFATPTFNLQELSATLASGYLRLTADGTPFVQDLSTISWGGFWGSNINSGGQIIGTGVSPNLVYSGALYQHTSSGAISLIYNFGPSTQGIDINERGDVLWANFDNSTSSYTTFHISPSGAVGQTIDLPITSYRRPAFNNQFQIVGGGINGGAFLFQNDQSYSLQSLVVNAAGFTLLAATDINDAGFITGYGRNALGENKAFLLTPATTPVPLPATFGLLSSSLLGLVSVARKRKLA